jgi:CBS domain-containing protein
MEKAQGTTVREAMHEVRCIPPDMLLADAADAMLDGKHLTGRLCVVDAAGPTHRVCHSLCITLGVQGLGI